MSIFQTLTLCLFVASDVHNPSLITAREDLRDIAERWGGGAGWPAAYATFGTTYEQLIRWKPSISSCSPSPASKFRADST